MRRARWRGPGRGTWLGSTPRTTAPRRHGAEPGDRGRGRHPGHRVLNWHWHRFVGAISLVTWRDRSIRRVAVLEVKRRLVRWHLQFQVGKKVCVVSGGLCLVQGGAAPLPTLNTMVDPVAFQDSCVEAFRTSQAVRGFAPTSMENTAGVLDRFLSACERPAWEVTAEDVDRVVAELIEQGLSPATRRGYVQAFKGFQALHNPGCSWGLNPPASRSARAMVCRLHGYVDRSS